MRSRRFLKKYRSFMINRSGVSGAANTCKRRGAQIYVEYAPGGVSDVYADIDVSAADNTDGAPPNHFCDWHMQTTSIYMSPLQRTSFRSTGVVQASSWFSSWISGRSVFCFSSIAILSTCSSLAVISAFPSFRACRNQLSTMVHHVELSKHCHWMGPCGGAPTVQPSTHLADDAELRTAMSQLKSSQKGRSTQICPL